MGDSYSVDEAKARPSAIIRWVREGVPFKVAFPTLDERQRAPTETLGLMV